MTFSDPWIACLPNGTALAATWDVDLIKKGGALQGDEAIAKGASVVLGPTMNMQRSPLGGRGFESFSEDPVLTGLMAAATVQGLQSKGVAATVKHFVCNDQEDERMKVDSIVTERALREIYTMPFQIAELLSHPWCYMTAYNKVNGIHASESIHLLKEIVREEWGADTMIMSDWSVVQLLFFHETDQISQVRNLFSRRLCQGRPRSRDAWSTLFSYTDIPCIDIGKDHRT